MNLKSSLASYGQTANIPKTIQKRWNNHCSHHFEPVPVSLRQLFNTSCQPTIRNARPSVGGVWRCLGVSGTATVQRYKVPPISKRPGYGKCSELRKCNKEKSSENTPAWFFVSPGKKVCVNKFVEFSNLNDISQVRPGNSLLVVEVTFLCHASIWLHVGWPSGNVVPTFCYEYHQETGCWNKPHLLGHLSVGSTISDSIWRFEKLPPFLPNSQHATFPSPPRSAPRSCCCSEPARPILKDEPPMRYVDDPQKRMSSTDTGHHGFSPLHFLWLPTSTSPDHNSRKRQLNPKSVCQVP